MDRIHRTMQARRRLLLVDVPVATPERVADGERVRILDRERDQGGLRLAEYAHAAHRSQPGDQRLRGLARDPGEPEVSVLAEIPHNRPGGGDGAPTLRSEHA